MATAMIQLLCHAKPGASANRESITAMTDKVIRVCMATQTRVENADEAIRVVIARTLKVSKPDVSIAKGMKH